MAQSHPTPSLTGPSVLAGITEQRLGTLLILSPSTVPPLRRVLYVNTYGGASVWEKIRSGIMPPHHLWGCLELVRQGYQVALAESLVHFNYRRPLPHDLSLFRIARQWLGRDGIIYCAHTLLFWVPMLKTLGFTRVPIVSLLYAREHLDFASTHSAIIALTPAAADNAAKLAPKAKIVHLGWGVDLNFFPTLPYQPNWYLSCGRTHRDHPTLNDATHRCKSGVRIISPQIDPLLRWPSNVTLVTGGRYDDTVSYESLLNDYYSGCTGSLIILNYDPAEKTAVGFTNLIEAMAMSRPVIVTRTGALASEIDVEKAGCGLHVPARDPEALARAITYLAENPDIAANMGRNGRKLCEEHYNILRYASGLHQLFSQI